MTNLEFFARYEKYFRKLLVRTNPLFASFVFSYGRKAFLKLLIDNPPDSFITHDYIKKINLWDLEFYSPLFNAAGMFKHGEGYELCAKQGAGAFLAGTTTATHRKGNVKKGIYHPFSAFPFSSTAINWMGLPNDGHEAVAKKLARIDKFKGCPVGASVASSPEKSGMEALESLCNGLNIYDRAGVDFIELNESCPNVEHEHCAESINGLDKNLVDRLEYISRNFLKKRSRNLPVIVKFSTDTKLEQLPELLYLLISLDFDGINIGNTSTDYSNAITYLDKRDKKLFDYFTSNFGGGISGLPLKNNSLILASFAAEYVNRRELRREFNVIRTGGITSPEDIKASYQNGIKLNQWFTGYFEMFSATGHNLYQSMVIDNK